MVAQSIRIEYGVDFMWWLALQTFRGTRHNSLPVFRLSVPQRYSEPSSKRLLPMECIITSKCWIKVGQKHLNRLSHCKWLILFDDSTIHGSCHDVLFEHERLKHSRVGLWAVPDSVWLGNLNLHTTFYAIAAINQLRIICLRIKFDMI